MFLWLTMLRFTKRRKVIKYLNRSLIKFANYYNPKFLLLSLKMNL